MITLEVGRPIRLGEQRLIVRYENRPQVIIRLP
jgi:hypothetical protein